MNIKELVNKYLPNFIFNDASSTSLEEIINLLEMCHINHKLLIYQKRNKYNDDIFEAHEKNYNIKNICEIFSNNDSEYIFNGVVISENNLSPLFYLKKQLTCDTDCVICYDNSNIEYMGEMCNGYCCDTCSAYYCNGCLTQLIESPDTFKCSICRTINNLPTGSTMY